MNALNTSEFVQVTERSCLFLPAFGYFIYFIDHQLLLCFLKRKIIFSSVKVE